MILRPSAIVAGVVVLLAGCVTMAACTKRRDAPGGGEQTVTERNKADPGASKPARRSARIPHPRARMRNAMVDRQIAGRDIRDEGVLAAMRSVPRHLFVSEALARRAYDDTPLPIGHGQTISQPYIVALMTELVRPERKARVLDVGTGSGYQAAVLAELVDHVYGIEIVCDLAQSAAARLKTLEYRNVTIKCGDGYVGWSEHAPFDIIVVAAAPKVVPPALLEQLRPGGRLVIPVGGDGRQELRLYVKGAKGEISVKHVAPVRFVPFVRKSGSSEASPKEK